MLSKIDSVLEKLGQILALSMVNFFSVLRTDRCAVMPCRGLAFLSRLPMLNVFSHAGLPSVDPLR